MFEMIYYYFLKKSNALFGLASMKSLTTSVKKQKSLF
jgi:hypothetical protein